MRRRLSAVVVVVAALVAGMLFIALPAFADVTAQEVEAARARLREVNQELSEQVAGYDAAVVREVELRDRLDRILVDLATMYMSAGSAETQSVLAAGQFAEVPARRAYLDSVARPTVRWLCNWMPPVWVSSGSRHCWRRRLSSRR